MTTTKPTKGLSLPTRGSAGAELRRLMLAESALPVGSPAPTAEDLLPEADFPPLPEQLLRSSRETGSAAPVSAIPLPPQEPVEDAPALPDTQATSNIVTQNTDNTITNTTGNIVNRVTDNLALQATGNAVTEVTPGHVSILHTAPMRAALLSALSEPIPPDPEKAKPRLQITSIKIRPAVWERIKVAAQLTGKNQQELIDEALRDLFAKILQGEN